MIQFSSKSLIKFPQRFPGGTRFRRSFIIAPYWSENDLDQAFRLDDQRASQVFFQLYDRLNTASNPLQAQIISRATAAVRRFQKKPSFPKFVARYVLVVSWLRLYPRRHDVSVSFNQVRILCMLIRRLVLENCKNKRSRILLGNALFPSYWNFSYLYQFLTTLSNLHCITVHTLFTPQMWMCSFFVMRFIFLSNEHLSILQRLVLLVVHVLLDLTEHV